MSELVEALNTLTEAARQLPNAYGIELTFFNEEVVLDLVGPNGEPIRLEDYNDDAFGLAIVTARKHKEGRQPH